MTQTESDLALVELKKQVIRELARPINKDLHTLKHALLAEFGSAISAILFYGSCLRTRNTGEGLVDLYILVDQYRDIHPSKVSQWASALLPPTVFLFKAINATGNEIRAKCAILSLDDFERGNRSWFQSYLWARFAQPSRLVFSRTPMTGLRIEDAVCHAVRRLISETIALQPAMFNNETFWTRALTFTYGTELRPENSERPALIARQNHDYFSGLLEASCRVLGAGYVGAQDEKLYINHTSPEQQRRQAMTWRVRRIQGQALNVLRLTRSLFTVKGGVDYAIWKLERHWGKPIEHADRLRRYPLIFCWPLLWQLLKKRRAP
ncbi:hypothetical protein G7009_00085 [Pseudomonas capeferrum]|uniref:hypothetical protein n=1 Tax=Pseudomonas capeferrum TaxID=1495066 RepID=UPI0015E444AB|nr:hypothetical protein [Pseudomonas capeferrum]MBA1200205.1 hypothetical protein [Pseudomonas capeferrum]